MRGITAKVAIAGTIGLVLLSSAAASAKTLNNDVHCLIISNLFAKKGATEEQRRVSQLTASFYLGRVDARSTPASLKAAMLAQKNGLPDVVAGKTMDACVTRAGAANNRIVTKARQITPPR